MATHDPHIYLVPAGTSGERIKTDGFNANRQCIYCQVPISQNASQPCPKAPLRTPEERTRLELEMEESNRQAATAKIQAARIHQNARDLIALQNLPRSM